MPSEQGDGSDPARQYQVWHVSDDNQALLAMIGISSPHFPKSYTRVATVETHSMDQAYYLTNHGEGPWQKNPGVQGIEGRSTSVGDVIVDPEGRAHRIERFGYQELPSSYESSVARVERELRQMKREPEILLESTRHYAMPDPEDADSVYDTCDALGSWETLRSDEKRKALAELDWRDVSPEDKRAIVEREVGVDSELQAKDGTKPTRSDYDRVLDAAVEAGGNRTRDLDRER